MTKNVKPADSKHFHNSKFKVNIFIVHDTRSGYGVAILMFTILKYGVFDLEN